MNIDELKKSSFLRRVDVAKPLLVTIAGGEKMNVAKEGAPEELKFCLSFEELEKPMVMNGTNLEVCARITGARDTVNWTGHKVVLYDDPNVSFGGKLTGGIRIRAPRLQAQPPPAAPAPTTLRDRAEASMPQHIGKFMPQVAAEEPGEDPY